MPTICQFNFGQFVETCHFIFPGIKAALQERQGKVYELALMEMKIVHESVSVITKGKFDCDQNFWVYMQELYLSKLYYKDYNIP